MAEIELELSLFDSVTMWNHLGENSEYIAVSFVFPSSPDSRMKVMELNRYLLAE